MLVGAAILVIFLAAVGLWIADVNVIDWAYGAITGSLKVLGNTVSSGLPKIAIPNPLVDTDNPEDRGKQDMEVVSLSVMQTARSNNPLAIVDFNALVEVTANDFAATGPNGDPISIGEIRPVQSQNRVEVELVLEQGGSLSEGDTVTITFNPTGQECTDDYQTGIDNPADGASSCGEQPGQPGGGPVAVLYPGTGFTERSDGTVTELAAGESIENTAQHEVGMIRSVKVNRETVTLYEDMDMGTSGAMMTLAGHATDLDMSQRVSSVSLSSQSCSVRLYRHCTAQGCSQNGGEWMICGYRDGADECSCWNRLEEQNGNGDTGECRELNTVNIPGVNSRNFGDAVSAAAVEGGDSCTATLYDNQDQDSSGANITITGEATRLDMTGRIGSVQTSGSSTPSGP